MNFKENETATKLRGGYYTPPDIARFLLRWALRGAESRPIRVLEPSCGDGVFLDPAAGGDFQGEIRFTAYETDPAEAAKARARLASRGKPGGEVVCRDFLTLAADERWRHPPFDAAVGNPPFIRYQYLEEPLQEAARRIFLRRSLPFTRHANAWVPFVIAALECLRPGGRLAMVTPAEILHVGHAGGLRTHLMNTCARVLIIDPEELWFDDALQGAVLLLAERKGAPSDANQGLAIAPVNGRQFTAADPEELLAAAAFVKGPSLAGKWTRALLRPPETALMEALESHPGVTPFATVAEVDVGIVTGANKFFLVPDATIEEYSLGRWAHPMFGRSTHCPGVIYDEAQHAANRDAGLPCNFLWLDEEEAALLPACVARYLAEGHRQKLCGRYKCRVRRPWYRVPSVYSTPLGMLKRCHNMPRLIHNPMRAYTTDTAYRILPKTLNPPTLTFRFVNSLTALGAELEGRHYGGGVLELVPSEIERLPVPLPPATAEDPAALRRLDADFKSGKPAHEILAVQDKTILRPLGLTPPDIETLRNAWNRLRGRRQRTSSSTEKTGP